MSDTLDSYFSIDDVAGDVLKEEIKPSESKLFLDAALPLFSGNVFANAIENKDIANKNTEQDNTRFLRVIAKNIVAISPTGDKELLLSYDTVFGMAADIVVRRIASVVTRASIDEYLLSELDLKVFIRELFLNNSCQYQNDVQGWHTYLHQQVFPIVHKFICEWSGNIYPGTNMQNPISNIFFGRDGILSRSLAYADVVKAARSSIWDVEPKIVSLVSNYSGPALEITYVPVQS
jgi:hypothetical protein